MPSTGWTPGGPVHQLPLEIDGLSLCEATSAAVAYQASLTSVTENGNSSIVRWIQSLSAGDLAAVARALDDVQALLHVIGAEPRFVGVDEPDFAGARVAFIGCPHRHTSLNPERTEQFLNQGGVLVTSDKAAMLPVLRDLLPVTKPRSPRRVRATWNTVQPYGSHDTGELSPAVALHAGHVPLDPVIGGRPRTQVITHDRLTGDPLAVVVRAGNGAVVHSVAHWYQEEYVQQNTALEARPLANVPRYAGLAQRYPGLSLGMYRAAETMLTTMLVGLDVALASARVSRQWEAS